MNAKKIMGAVLVALLAAALFVGAGAADVTDKGTYFAYQKGLTGLDGVWQNGANTVTVSNNNVSDVLVAGTYTKGDMSAYFTKPTATYVANGKLGDVKYIVANGGNVYAGSNLTIVVTSLNATVGVDQIRVEYPNGLVSFESPDFFKETAEALTTAGTYKVQAVWNATGNFTVGAPLPVVDANVFTFTVVEPSDATISASVDTVFAGDVISVTIKGTPGEKYYLNLTGFNATQKLNQIVNLEVNTTGLNFTMPNIAEVTFQLETSAKAKDEVKVELTLDAKKADVIGEVVIAVAKPALTATLGATSYFIGNEIELTLTSDIEIKYGNYDFNITGTNFKETVLTETKDSENNGKSFTVYLPTAGVTDGQKKLDVGTYTIKIYQGGDVVKTVSVVLKQPFISIIEAPEVVVQGDEAEFVINAEAADNITAYVFGTNYFLSTGPISADKDISNQFTVKVFESETANMSTGQYFAVFQHPMYDTFYNIYANNVDGKFYLNTQGNAGSLPGGSTANLLFNVNDRQTANAAQALCDALDSQNIDDMYVKASFFVVGEDESFTISEIPATIAQGETLTISGVSTANAENEVTVEMISTAFAAVPKETVGSAAFILVTTEVAEDGTWEVTLDTSDLNVDEYSLKVAVAKDGKSETWKNVNINVVEAADEPVDPEQPGDEPEQPGDEPVAPETPGFGALAALAGLGAVAVLLLRRE